MFQQKCSYGKGSWQINNWHLNNPMALFKGPFLKKDEITDALLIQIIFIVNTKKYGNAIVTNHIKKENLTKSIFLVFLPSL